MLLTTCLLACLLGVCLGSGYGYHKPTEVHCFMCEYRPPKTYTIKVPREETYEVKVPKTTYECKEEKVFAGNQYVEDKKDDSYGYGDHSKGYGDHGNSYGTHGNSYGTHGNSHGFHGNNYGTHGNSHGDYGKGHADIGHGYGYTSRGYGHQGYGYGHGSGYGHRRSYGHYEPQYKTVKRCYPKAGYETETRSRTVYDTETKTARAGGFDPCMGPITAESAKVDGVDDWECHSSCYTRVDKEGNVSRGCYKDEFGLDPHSTKPQTVTGMTYTFCEGNHCNGDKVTPYKPAY